MRLFTPKPFALVATFLAVVLVALAQREASAQSLVLAQTGGAKTAIGYALVLLCILLGMVVVLRPNKRKLKEKTKQAGAKR